MHRLHLRWIISRDLPAVLPISEASFTEAWSGADFERALGFRNVIGFVATWGDIIVGYVVYELHRDRVNILNLAVSPTARRCGVGSALLAKLRYKVCSHRRESLTARVEETNLAGLCFFRSAGLRAVSVAGDEILMAYRPTADEWEGFGRAPVNRIATILEGN